MEANPKEGDSDMSWEHDSPEVIFKDPRPFAVYANEPSKRSFDSFAEGAHLPQSREFSDYTMTQTLGPNDGGVDASWPANPAFQEARAPGGDNSKAWRYVEASCNFFSSIAVNTIEYTANTKVWKNLYGHTRYLLSGYKRIDTTLTAIEQIANGAKRRYIELATSRHEKRMSNQEQHRRQSYHRGRATKRDREHFYSAHQQTVAFNAPDNEFSVRAYYMSGALADDDLDIPRTPTRINAMPGTWVESPVSNAALYGNPYPDDVHADSASPEHDPNTIATSPSDPNEVLATHPAWPYCGNEIYHVELQSTGVDDEGSTMTVTDVDEEGISSDSIIAPENLDTGSSSDSDDHDMPDTDNSELESLSSDSNSLVTHEFGSQAVPSGPYARHNNTNPDAIQRAAVDEMQAILDDNSMLLEDLMDVESPPLPSEVPGSPLTSDPVDEINLIQTPQAATETATVPGMSPLSLSNYSRSTVSTPDSNASRWKISPKDSPAWSYTLSPKHKFSSPFRRSPISHPLRPPVRLFPYGLALSRAGSPKKRVTFFQSPKTGRPVNMYKKYIIGESMDVSYVSASEEDYSMLSDTSATGRLYPSPTCQEHIEKQLMAGKDDPELLRSLSADFAPVDAHAHIPVIHPPRVFSEITNARTRQHRDASGFAVTTAGSSMHSHSANAESEEDIHSSFDNEALTFTKDSHHEKENKSPFSQTDVLADSPLTVSSPSNGSTSTSNFTHAVTPTRAQGSLAHGTGCCPPEEHSPSNQTTYIPVPPNPASEGTLAHGKDVSSNEDYSPSNQIDASAAFTPPSLSSYQGPSIDDNDSASQRLSTSNSSEPATATDTPEDRSDDEVLSNEQGTISPTSRSTQCQTPAVAVMPDPSSATGILETGISSTSTTNGISPLDQLGVSDVTANVESSSAQGTLVIGKESICATNGNSPSDQVDASAIDSTPAPTLTGGTLVIGKASPSARKGGSPSDQVDAPATPSPSQVARDLAGLNVSGRRTSIRLTTKALKDAERRAAKEARIAAEKARKEKEEAEKKARKKKELEAERRRTGVRRKPVVKIIEPLSNEWETRVTETMKEANLMKVLTASVAATEITRRDLGKVLPQRGVPGEDQSGWLNDTIITAYLDTTVDHALKTSGHKRGEVPKQVAFSTYFYPRLAKEGAASVSRWVKRAKIEGKKMKDVERIYIPINENRNHWVLLVVSPKFKTIEYFDSMGGDGEDVIGHAKALLKQELGGDYKEREWTVQARGGPRQTNGSDCGVFVSTTAKMISLGVDPMAYSSVDIPMQRRRIVAELMNGGFHGELAPNVVFADDD
ncbi:MAG: hypothetical protein Q9195_001443 [Heterodermia aff. obscurata]